MNQNYMNSLEATHSWRFARTITFLIILGITVMASMAINLAKDKAVASQAVLTTVLPLLAAWVSTVLAYYYSSESIEAATQSVKDLMSPDDRLKTTFAADKMIKLQELNHFTYTDELKRSD